MLTRGLLVIRFAPLRESGGRNPSQQSRCKNGSVSDAAVPKGMLWTHQVRYMLLYPNRQRETAQTRYSLGSNPRGSTKNKNLNLIFIKKYCIIYIERIKKTQTAILLLLDIVKRACLVNMAP